MNKRFFTFHEKKRPYIILKWAQSSDGKISGFDGKRIFISNEFSNRLVHKWRSEEAAILIGTKTALSDDPELTTRLYPGKDPLRLVIDKKLSLPASLKVFDGKVRTVVFNSIKNEAATNVFYYQLKGEENFVQQLLKALYEMQVQSMIVEGGAKLLQSFIDENAWDEARVINNEKLIINDGLDAPQLKNEKLVNNEEISSDLIYYYEQLTMNY